MATLDYFPCMLSKRAELKVRALNLFILVSAALHALVLVALPLINLRVPAEPVPLEVTLAPARPLPTGPLIEMQRPQPRPPQREKTPPPPRQQSIERAPVLALPRELSVPEPRLTVPAPEPRTAPEPPAPTPAAQEPERALSKVERAPPESVSSPVYNAAYLRNPEPRYPMSARRRGEQGTVVLKVLVTREGTVASVSVDRGSGSAALDQAALDTVRMWRFAPARRGAEAIESSVLVPIVFRLEGAS